MTDRTYTPAEFAKLLFLSPSRVRTLTREGVFRASITTQGGHRRYTEDDLVHAQRQLASANEGPTSVPDAMEPVAATEANDLEQLVAAILESGRAKDVQVNMISKFLEPAEKDVQERIAMRLALAWHTPLSQALRFVEAFTPEIVTQTPSKNPARVHVFASPKGGVGKSSTALNYAAVLATRHDPETGKLPRVLLIDGDLAYGSQSVRVIGKPPRPSLHSGGQHPLNGTYEPADIPSMLDMVNYMADKVREGYLNEPLWFEGAPQGQLSMRDFVLARESAPNLHILAAPDEPDFLPDMQPDEYREILKRLDHFYDHIVIDAGTEMWAHYNQVWYESAHAIFVLMKPDLATINSCRKFVRYITRGRAATRLSPARLALTSKDKLRLVMVGPERADRIDWFETVRKIFIWAHPNQRLVLHNMQFELDRAANAQEFLALTNYTYGNDIATLIESSGDDPMHNAA